jgi:hypothetical protein
MTSRMLPVERTVAVPNGGAHSVHLISVMVACCNATACHGRSTNRTWSIQRRIQLALMRRTCRLFRRLVTLGARRTGHEPRESH